MAIKFDTFKVGTGTATGGLEYKGAFNATTGLPDLSNAEQGDFYVVDTAGTIYGQTWAVGDHLLINADMSGTITNSKIDKIDNTDSVTSVNAQVGAVVLSANDLTADHTAVNYTATNANIDGHLSGIDTALGTSLSPTLDDVTTNGDTTTNAINVGTITTSGDIMPDADATRTIGDENTRFISIYSDINGAIRFKAKNNQGTAISKGQAVYISGISGTVPEVKLAQANSALTMPAFGLALTNANNLADVEIITFGNLTDYNTTTYSLSLGDTVYISETTAGALTSTPPTGESNFIQNIGRVLRADASAGIIKVGGAGRSNATPNLDQDKIFLGNASNQAVSTALSSVNLSSFNDDLSYPVTSVNTLTGAVVVSGNDIAADHTATNYTAANANVDGHFSGVDTKFGTLGTASTQDVGTSANNVVQLDGTAKLPAVDGSQLTNLPSAPVTSVNTLTGAVVVSGNDIAADHTATNYTAANANVDGHLSGIDTKLGTLLSDITNEGLNDLSDVSFTAGPGIDNYVLTYDNSTTSWGAEVVPSAPVTSVNTLTGAVVVSGNDIAADHTATNYTAANANVDGHFSGVDTKLGTLLADITSESLGDLSDVTITAAASGEYLRYNGSAWVDASLAVADDSTPSLGGDLDTNGNELVTASNANLVLRPNGTGHVFLGGNTNPAELRLYCESADAHYVGFKSPTHAQLSGSQTWRLPTADGTPNQAIITDGSGNLSFTTISGGGASWTYSAITADPANAQANYHYSCTGTFTITLPTSGLTAGDQIRIKNMGTGTITIDPQTVNIDGSTTDYVLDVQYSSITLVSDGTNYEVV